MESPFPEGSLLSRTKNFRWNTESLERQYREDENSFLAWEILRDIIIAFCANTFIKKVDVSERLEQVLRKMYDTIRKSELAFQLFCGESPLADHAYEVFIFTACSCFLHTSKRIKGMSLTEFVRKNSPLDFTNPDSPNYRQLYLQQAEIDKLRKARQRRLNQARVYLKKVQWNAMTKDAEYEWTRYYELSEADDVVSNLDKRLGNLYKGFIKAINAEQNDEYIGVVQDAYKKFLSKLQKLKYEDFLTLYKTELIRICRNKKYFGINLYRLERRLQPYKIVNEVKKLVECNSLEEEADLLLKTVYLDEICFPKIYEYLLHNPVNLVRKYADEFYNTWITERVISNLLLDELVEKGLFGDNWEALFLDKINEIAPEVLYDPQKVEFFTAEHAQEKFIRLLHAGVRIETCAACRSGFHTMDLLI